MEGLFDKRSSAEQAFLERYMAAAESYERQLEDLRCADAEDYNLLKVRSVHVIATIGSPSSRAMSSSREHIICLIVHQQLCWGW